MRQLHWIKPDDPVEAFPTIGAALEQPAGLLAAGGDLSPQRLLAGYRRGIFPWYEAGQPILWWCPDPRAVIVPGELHVSRSLRRTIRRGLLHTTVDRDYGAVVDGCAAERPGQHGTWITPEMNAAYRRLHALGHAHSIETWHGTKLVGGVYGVALGRVFFAESMFSRASDASKIALCRLVEELQRWNYRLIDCQMTSPHLASLGAREIPRPEFVALVAELTATPASPAAWTADDKDG